MIAVKELRRQLTKLQSRAYSLHTELSALIREIDKQENE